MTTVKLLKELMVSPKKKKKKSKESREETGCYRLGLEHELSGPRRWGDSIDGFSHNKLICFILSVVFSLLIWTFFFFGDTADLDFRQLGFCKYLKRPRPQLINRPRQYFIFWVFLFQFNVLGFLFHFFL